VNLLPFSYTVLTGGTGDVGGKRDVGGKSVLRNGWERLGILRLWKLLENVRMQGARNPEERRTKEHVTVTKDERDAAVSIRFERGDAGPPAAP